MTVRDYDAYGFHMLHCVGKAYTTQAKIRRLLRIKGLVIRGFMLTQIRTRGMNIGQTANDWLSDLSGERHTFIPKYVHKEIKRIRVLSRKNRTKTRLFAPLITAFTKWDIALTPMEVCEKYHCNYLYTNSVRMIISRLRLAHM